MTTYLEEKIKYFDEEYRAGRALITDTQFDQLEKNLLRIDPDCDYFTNKKALPLPSLPKDRIEEFIEGLLPDTSFRKPMYRYHFQLRIFLPFKYFNF